MNWNSCWLNYSSDSILIENQLKEIVTADTGNIIRNAAKELKDALEKKFRLSICIKTNISKDILPREDGTIYLNLLEESNELSLLSEGYHLYYQNGNIYIEGITEVGILYGVYHFIRLLQMKVPIASMDVTENPSNPLRMLNHWDNMDGDIERGYAGNSIFFCNNEITISKRTIDYARLCASIGINGVVINNVNVRGAATDLITLKYLEQLQKLAEILEGYGIKLYLSANFASPIEIGGLETADPIDKDVIQWWKNQTKLIFSYIPNFGGFLIKADSEFRPGPFTYGRTHDQGANMLAKALKTYGGLLIWRCFVYNCTQDWRDLKTDRARAAYDHFMPLDGKFQDNVILQIKNGPMDFQVREPVSPLFGGLQKTNQILEVQAAQEYTGQQKHVCYLVPMWKEVLDFKTYVDKAEDKVSDIVSGKTFNQQNCGMAAVSNIGNDVNWTGHDLATANWYGFGRLSWNPALTSEEIANEWIVQTFSNHKYVLGIIKKILLSSYSTYEKYTSPLGIGWMVNPNHHYGPSVDGYEYSKWGTYHRADHKGLGVDRTTDGTKYTTQYLEPNASMYNKKETCPDELLLFFHHIPYTYLLKSNKTLIQHIYDTHFEGVEEVKDMMAAWENLKDMIEDEVFYRVRERFVIQLESAEEWRDVVNTYFYRKSGIEDQHSRKFYG